MNAPLEDIIDQLHVKTPTSETIICYKDKVILRNGWCKTSGLNTGKRDGWGVCSESCKFIKNKVVRERTSEDFNKVCTCYSMPINFFNVVSISISLSSQIRTTKYHEGSFKLIDRDTDFIGKGQGNSDDIKCNSIDMEEDMKDKSLCVVDIKPHTDVWTFELKYTDAMKLDTKMERKAITKKEFSPPGGKYMGKLYLFVIMLLLYEHF